MKPLRVAVIGCGSIAKHRHVPEYAGSSLSTVAALCDIVPARAQALADKFGGKVYTDWEEVVNLKTIDAVSVCTPNYLHAPVSIAALKAGKHVLCEKPMATSAAETDAMCAAAQASGKTLMIGHNQRLAPLHVRAKQILKSGILGKVLSFRTNFAHGGPETWSADGVGGWFFQKEKAFVGAMGDLGVHKADLLRWLFDDEIVEVAAFVEALADKQGSDVDDTAVCIFRMASGAIGTMMAGWMHKPGGDNSTIIYCQHGIMRIDTDPTYNVIVDLASGERQLYHTAALQTNDEGGQTTSGVINTFLTNIAKKRPSQIPGEEGAKSLAVIIACLESAATKQFVQVGGVLAAV